MYCKTQVVAKELLEVKVESCLILCAKQKEAVMRLNADVCQTINANDGMQEKVELVCHFLRVLLNLYKSIKMCVKMQKKAPVLKNDACSLRCDFV